MKFNIEDVEIKVSRHVGLAQFGETYVMTHKPTGLKVTIDDPITVKNERKLAAIDDLKKQVEAREEA